MKWLRGLGGGIGALLGLAFALLSIAIGLTLLFAPGRFIRILEFIGPFLTSAVVIGLVVSLFVGLPLLIWRKTRGASEVIFQFTAWGLGTLTWMVSVVAIYHIWGGFMTIVGVVTGPFILPLVLIAALTAAKWSVLWTIIGSAVIWLILIAGATFASSNRYPK